MKDEFILSHRLAKALFQLGEENEKVFVIHEELKTLCLADLEEKLYKSFNRLPIDDQRKAMKTILKGADDYISKTIEMLIDRKSLHLLHEIFAHYAEISKVDPKKIIVQSVTKLTDKQNKEIIKKYEASYQRKAIIENEICPELIGGVRIVLEGAVLDYSLAARLKSLKDYLRAQPCHL